MNIFVLSGILICITSFVLIAITLRYGKLKLHRIWLLFNFSVGIWGLASIFIGQAKVESESIFWFKFAHIGIIFLPVLLFHSISLLCNLNKTAIVNLIYIQAIIFLLFNFFTNDFIAGTEKKFSSLFWLNPGVLYLPFLGLYFLIISYSFYELIVAYRSSEGNKKIQVGYFLIGMLVGFSGGLTNFLPVYKSIIYPVGNFTIPIYCIIVTYAVFKYRLLDVTIAVTRTGIFVAVYSIVLGIPFILAFVLRKLLLEVLGDNWWMVPLVSSTVLATAGPFIFLYIQKKAEERIFQEQRRYQNTLRQASSGMGRIKDLDRLVNLIVHIVTKTVRLEHALIYLIDVQQKKYFLRSSRSQDVRFNPAPEIDSSSPLIKYLFDSKSPIVYDEIKQRTEDYGDLNMARLEAALKELNAALVVPSFVDDRLLAIIVLGKKESGVLYTEDDLTVFSILANQAALAIENAQFYEDVKNTHEQLFKAEKMATIGTMADGLSHQINNRLHALGFIASDVLDTIKLKKNLPMTAELKEMLIDIEHGLTRIQENVTQGGEIVRGLLKYTRKGEEGFAEVDLNQLLDSAIEMTQFKIKSGEMTVLREFGRDVPKIRGNFTQLQEVFFNLIDNAFDAMMQRKNELQEPSYEATIKISAENSENGHLKILVADNGIGIKDEDKNKLFTPFFTTKLSSKKGTGLGLYVIRKLIEENHGGKVVYDSKFKQGTRVILHLPIYNHS